MKTRILAVSCLLLGACGGKGAVDLGGNSGPAGWADTTGSAATASTVTSKPAAVPQTLYAGGEHVLAIAVDETTIAAAIRSELTNDTRVDICQLADCKNTLQTIYTQLAAGACADPHWVIAPSRVLLISPYESLLISHGEVIWPACGSDGGHRLLACSVSGCPEGARQIAPCGSIVTSAATADWLYWLESAPINGIARCPRTGCDTPEFQPIPESGTDSSYPGASCLAVDEAQDTLYASGAAWIASMPADFSTGLNLFYEDPLNVEGLSIVGDSIYFAVSTLTGQIRRCQTAGCQQGSELVTVAPRWPTSLVADEKGVYWLHDALVNVNMNNEVSISTLPLDGSSTTHVVVERTGGVGVVTDLSCKPAINSHHLYWCEGPTSTIRMVAR